MELNLKLELSVNRDNVFVKGLKKINVVELREDCNNYQWEEVLDFSLIDDKVALFNKHLLNIFNKHIPERQISRRGILVLG